MLDPDVQAMVAVVLEHPGFHSLLGHVPHRQPGKPETILHDGWAVGFQLDEASAVLSWLDAPTLSELMDKVRDCWHLEAPESDVCGLCGQPGADKFKSPEHWPGEANPDGDLVHSECEQAERERAYQDFRSRVGEDGVRAFLRRNA